MTVLHPLPASTLRLWPRCHGRRPETLSISVSAASNQDIDTPLFFANARTFREQVRALVRAEPPPRRIIVAASP